MSSSNRFESLDQEEERSMESGVMGAETADFLASDGSEDVEMVNEQLDDLDAVHQRVGVSK